MMDDLDFDKQRYPKKNASEEAESFGIQSSEIQKSKACEQ